jgi:YbbR domain-containing protein
MNAIWPFRHFGLKLLSVGVAVLLWLVVAGEQTVERGLRVPLELQQFPEGLELEGEPPSLVDVRVRGASGALGRISAGDLVAVLDLHAARPGRRLYQLTPEQVRTPFDVQVLQITPASIALEFESSLSRHVPVAPTIEGEPAPGYIVGKVTVEPQMVEIVGPESAVKETADAITESISVNGAQQQVTESVTVGLLDPMVRLKTAGQAIVTVQVLPGPRERTLRDRPVHLRALSQGLTARALPEVVSVVLRGSAEGIGRVQPDAVNAFVDLAGLGAGQYTLTVHVDPSPDAGIARVVPDTVQVRIASARN